MGFLTKGGAQRSMRKFASLILLMAAVMLIQPSQKPAVAATSWLVRSVDTQVRSKCWTNVQESNIDQEVSMLKSLGVNYIAIGTPYDRPEEMAKWVNSIHKAGLNVWFRSHWLNWEGDEGQPKNMTPKTYVAKTYQFILDHPDFFHDGDSFTMNVEAENAGVGSGQPFADWNAYRAFLVEEIDSANEAFSQLGFGDSIKTNWLSMNGWVIENVLDQTTVDKMGMITPDHYPQQGSGTSLTPIAQLASEMSADLDRFHTRWNVPIMIGEWGYNINGEVTDDQQKQAVEAVYNVLASKSYIYGVSYWDSMGNQTRIINDSGGTPTTFRPAAEVIKNYFSAPAPVIEPPTPTPTSSILIANFETGLDGFDGGTWIAGFDSAHANRFTNPANGDSGGKKDISSISFSGMTHLEFDVNLNGNKLIKGDASAVYFEQGGWKYVTLADPKYAINRQNGWQHVKIPLTDFGLNGEKAAFIGFRFWNHTSGSYDIDNITLTNGSAAPSPVVSQSALATFETGYEGFVGGTLVNGYQSVSALSLSNPANGSVGTEKSLDGKPLGDYSRIDLDLNLHGNKLLTGDASALYFQQGGWRFVSLEKYAANGLNGWQHLSIPLSDFTGLSPTSGIASIGFRFWNNVIGTYDIDNIVLK